MKADEAAELMEQGKETERFREWAAIEIAILAVVLVITGLGSSSAGSDAIIYNVQASDTYSFYQAKNIRQANLNTALDQMEFGWKAQAAISEDARKAIEAKTDEYRKKIAIYESDPQTGEGKKELLAKARDFDAKRDRALKQGPYFDYAEALIQIAIVLISVAIVSGFTSFAWIGGALGLFGAVLTLNGFYLLFEIPWFG